MLNSTFQFQMQPSGTRKKIVRGRRVGSAGGGFIDVASHHMRTPLTTIRWYVELLRSNEAGSLNRRQAEVLAEIDAGIRDVVCLLNELLGTPAGAEDRMEARASAHAPFAAARSNGRLTRKIV